jgi:hypothetical protein
VPADLIEAMASMLSFSCQNERRLQNERKWAKDSR